MRPLAIAQLRCIVTYYLFPFACSGKIWPGRVKRQIIIRHDCVCITCRLLATPPYTHRDWDIQLGRAGKASGSAPGTPPPSRRSRCLVRDEGFDATGGPAENSHTGLIDQQAMIQPSAHRASIHRQICLHDCTCCSPLGLSRCIL